MCNLVVYSRISLLEYVLKSANSLMQYQYTNQYTVKSKLFKIDKCITHSKDKSCPVLSVWPPWF